MISLIPLPYKLGIAAVAVAVLTAAAYFKGREAGLERYYEFKSEVEAANATVAAENERKMEEARANTGLVAEAYSRHSADIERTYVSRLRQARSHCATVPLVAASASLPDAGVADERPPAESYEATCERLERDCAKTTLMVYGLQDYIIGVCK